MVYIPVKGYERSPFIDTLIYVSSHSKKYEKKPTLSNRCFEKSSVLYSRERLNKMATTFSSGVYEKKGCQSLIPRRIEDP